MANRIRAASISAGNGLPFQQFGSDSFTDTNGTLITAHTNDASVQWTLQSGVSVTNHAIINNGRLYSQDANNTYTSNFVPNTANYEVYGKFYKFTDGTCGITGRASTTENTYYALRYDGIGWQLNRVVAGVSVQIGNAYLDDWANTTEREVILWFQGVTIKAFIDGIERISVIDTMITEAGRGGITMRTPSTTTTGIHLDAFRLNQPVLTPEVLLLNDEFTDPNGTLLTAHTSNTGQAWNVENGTVHTGTQIVNGNLVVSPSGNIYTIAMADLTDYSVRANLVFIANNAINEAVAIIGRKVAGELTYYDLSFSRTRGTVQLSRVVNGTNTSIGSFATTFTSGTMELELIFRGSNIIGRVNGVTRISAFDTQITAGKAGVRSHIFTPTNAGIHINNFTVSDIVETGYDNLYDSFTNANGTILREHTIGESGYLWIVQPNNSDTNPAVFINNRIRAGGNGNYYYLNKPMSSANYEVEASFLVITNTGSIGVSARCSNSENTFYRWRYSDSGNWALIKHVANTVTTLATFSQTLTAGNVVTCKIVVNGSTIEGWVNGVLRATVTDTDIPSAGFAGINMPWTVTDTTGLHMQDWKVRAL